MEPEVELDTGAAFEFVPGLVEGVGGDGPAPVSFEVGHRGVVGVWGGFKDFGQLVGDGQVLDVAGFLLRDAKDAALGVVVDGSEHAYFGLAEGEREGEGEPDALPGNGVGGEAGPGGGGGGREGGRPRLAGRRARPRLGWDFFEETCRCIFDWKERAARRVGNPLRWRVPFASRPSAIQTAPFFFMGTPGGHRLAPAALGAGDTSGKKVAE